MHTGLGRAINIIFFKPKIPLIFIPSARTPLRLAAPCALSQPARARAAGNTIDPMSPTWGRLLGSHNKLLGPQRGKYVGWRISDSFLFCFICHTRRAETKTIFKNQSVSIFFLQCFALNLDLFSVPLSHRTILRSNSEQEKLSRGVKKLRNLTNIDFQGDGSLDALLLELLERTNVFWTPHTTDYLLLFRIGPKNCPMA